MLTHLISSQPHYLLASATRAYQLVEGRRHQQLELLGHGTRAGVYGQYHGAHGDGVVNADGRPPSPP
jgi:hypothetical protein